MSASQPYLFKPGGVTLPLPWMQPGSTADPSRGETVIPLSGGGTTVARRLTPKRSFSLVYANQGASAAGLSSWGSASVSGPADTLLGLYSGLFDDPVTANWVFVDPTVRNVLSLDASSTGQRSQATVEWAQSAGGLAVSTSLVSPPNGAGVLSWTGVTANANVAVGLANATVDPTKGAPYLPLEPVTGSLWVYASASTSVQVQLRGYNAAGALVSGATASTAVTAGTSWQRASVSIAAGAPAFAACTFIRLVLAGPSSSTGNVVSFSGGQLEYASAVSAWQLGQGTPRVVITSSIGRAVQMVGYSDHTLTMAEV